MHNLYFDAEYATVVRELERDLLEWLITTTRPKTIHGSQLTDEETPQRTRHYQHSVNYDGKMHPVRVHVAAKHGGFRNYQ